MTEGKYENIKEIIHSDFLDRPATTTVMHDATVDFPCPECGGEAEADVSVVLTTYPGQYNYHCPHCGATGSVLCAEVDKYSFDKKVWDAMSSAMLHGAKCIICGEEIAFAEEIERPYVCQKCKKAVLAMRRLLEKTDA